MDSCGRCSWNRVAVTATVLLLLLSQIAHAAPAQKESDEGRLTNALLRLDDALDTLAAYFKDTKKEQTVAAAAAPGAVKLQDEAIEEPTPERPEQERRGEVAALMQNQDGQRPEFTAELDELNEKELAEVPDAPRVDDEEDTNGEDEEARQETVLRAALRYLLKVQKQERSRQKKDYDIPFPVFGYKRGQATE